MPEYVKSATPSRSIVLNDEDSFRSAVSIALRLLLTSDNDPLFLVSIDLKTVNVWITTFEEPVITIVVPLSALPIVSGVLPSHSRSIPLSFYLLTAAFRLIAAPEFSRGS